MSVRQPRRLRRALSAAVLAAVPLAASACAAGQVAPEAARAASTRLSGSGLVFTTLAGQQTGRQTLNVRNDSARAVTVEDVGLLGATKSFALHHAALPATLAPGKALALEVSFTPAASMVGVVRAKAYVSLADATGLAALFPLRGLSRASDYDEGEPALAQILAVEDLRTDVGARTLALGMDPDPIGSEVRAQRFVQAGAEPARIRTLARFSPQGGYAVGYSTGSTADAPGDVPVATIRATSAQTLSPQFTSGQDTVTFDAGGRPFGMYAHRANGPALHSLDALNPELKHVMRIYPVPAAGGTTTSYVVAIEEGVNGDYQDLVLLLENVRPAS